MAEIAEIEEILDFDDLVERAMAEIDNVDVLTDWQDPRKRQLTNCSYVNQQMRFHQQSDVIFVTRTTDKCLH